MTLNLQWIFAVLLIKDRNIKMILDLLHEIGNMKEKYLIESLHVLNVEEDQGCG